MKYELVVIGTQGWAVPEGTAWEPIPDPHARGEFVPGVRVPAGPAIVWRATERVVSVHTHDVGGGSYESDDGMSSRLSNERAVYRSAREFRGTGGAIAFVWADGEKPTATAKGIFALVEQMFAGEGGRLVSQKKVMDRVYPALSARVFETEAELPPTTSPERFEPVGIFVGDSAGPLARGRDLEDMFLEAAINRGFEI